VTTARKRSRREWAIRFDGELIRLYPDQWEAILLLGPMWMLLKPKVIPHQSRNALVRRKWAEFKVVAGFIMGRLTWEGMALRDSIHIREAERTNRSLWTPDGKLRKVPLDRKASIPTT